MALKLGLVWQLMRKYTLSLLAKLSPDGTPIVESEIITWANQRLQDAGKGMSIKHFQVTNILLKFLGLEFFEGTCRFYKHTKIKCYVFSIFVIFHSCMELLRGVE